jgi:hypothetical protein
MIMKEACISYGEINREVRGIRRMIEVVSNSALTKGTTGPSWTGDYREADVPDRKKQNAGRGDGRHSVDASPVISSHQFVNRYHLRAELQGTLFLLQSRRVIDRRSRQRH